MSHAARAPEVLRYSAFGATPEGGNPAGVVLHAHTLDAASMLSIARDVGYSETAFLWPAEDAADGRRHFTTRYFSPRAEVDFCGHATVAAAVAHAERHGAGELALHTRAGLVPVTTRREPSGENGAWLATLTSVAARVEPLAPEALAEMLAALRWSPAELDPALPPRVGFAGNFHPVVALASRARLAQLDYDHERLLRLMDAQRWTTLQLVVRATPTRFHARDPFPVGGVVEDPATGAAAAALGAYLHSLGLVKPPARVEILQGEDMGRPSRLLVDVPVDLAQGVRVTGGARAIA